MANSKTGDTVKIHYTGSLKNGKIFDSSKDREPLQFTIGSGQVISGFDQGVLGMAVGDIKTIAIDAKNAYGPVNPALIQKVRKDQFNPDLPLEIGNRIQLSNGQGQTMIVTITAVDEHTVTLDSNHPLAGNNLIFEIELVEILEK
ncbi:MAG TPA: peptidylprolyl isomerase [Sedimentisphaerales bacterium]|nr:peptidylprolyl isomerase [Sedimentisphaerales bacterium]